MKKNIKDKQARSSAAEHCFDVAGVSGSNPLVPTRKIWLMLRIA